MGQRSRNLAWTIAVLSVAFSTSGAARTALAPVGGSLAAEAEGFKVSYRTVTTPKAEWGTERETEWFTTFEGDLTSTKPISYRGVVLAPGKHDVWIEKGKGDWFHFLVGDRKDEEAPRLRSMFKLYDKETGVDELRFELKLTKNATTLKFSVLAGSSEGHSNFKIEAPAPPQAGGSTGI